MTKSEFMTQLASELRKRNVADVADVVDEYEQHFAFKLADGYTDEEIAARLGDPVAVAAQFGAVAPAGVKHTAALTSVFRHFCSPAGCVWRGAGCVCAVLWIDRCVPDRQFGAVGVCFSAAHAVLVRSHTWIEFGGAVCAVCGRVYLVRRFLPPDIPFLWSVPPKYAGPEPRRRGTARSPDRTAVRSPEKASAAHGGIDRAAAVCGLLRPGLCGVQSLCRGAGILAYLGMVPELR